MNQREPKAQTFYRLHTPLGLRLLLSTDLTSSAVSGANKYGFSSLKGQPLLSILTQFTKHLRPVLLKLFLIALAHPTYSGAILDLYASPYGCTCHSGGTANVSVFLGVHSPGPKLLEHREHASASSGSSASCSVLNKQSMVI